MKALDVKNVNLRLNGNLILDDISMSVEEGTIYGLIGHNGAGKTSLLRIILGLTTGYKGMLQIFESSKLNEMRVCMGAVIDSLGVDNSLTAKKYIHHVSYMLGVDSADEENILLEKVGLAETGKKTIGKFSLGMKRRLFIAAALVGHPKILILDEPFNGIDPEGMSDIRMVLQQLSYEGMTILVTSHNIPELIKLSTVFGIMHKGKFIDSISASELETMSYKKTVFRTSSPQTFIQELRVAFPTLDCSANSPGEISVFGNLDYTMLNEIRNRISKASISDVYETEMSEEEILLWRMNGFIK